MDKADLNELQRAFSDLLNYEAEDPVEPIDPVAYRTPEGDSCLHIAALRGDIRSVKLLIEAGLDINERGDMGNTPFHYALKGAHKEIADYLISKGAARDIENEFGGTS